MPRRTARSSRSRTDGTGEQQLTRPEAGGADDMPDWSPDGRLIAYQHCSEGRPCSVWRSTPTAATRTQVHFHCRLDGCDAAGPGWTPDGRLVATRRAGSRADVRRRAPDPAVRDRADRPATAASSAPSTSAPAGRAARLTPQVSPDGRTVIYTRWNSARSKPPFGKGLFAVGIDGSGNRQVAPWRLGGGDHAVFSPDGSILFRSFEDDDSKQSDFWTVRPDGSRPQAAHAFRPGHARAVGVLLTRRQVDRARLRRRRWQRRPATSCAPTAPGTGHSPTPSRGTARPTGARADQPAAATAAWP